MPRLTTLKVRSEFLAVRGGARASVPSCLIEARRRPLPPNADQRPDSTASSDGPRFGFTVTKKLGNAVTRNRIRRRLKDAIAGLAPDHAKAGFDYVIVARSAAFDRPFREIVADLVKAFGILHRSPGPREAERAKSRLEKRQT